MKLAGTNHNQLKENEDGGHDLGVFESRIAGQLLAEEILEDEEEGEHEQTPKGSNYCGFVRTINVHANEDDDAEVGVQSVADEQGGEDDPPGGVVVVQTVGGISIENTFDL
jgi:hypothetical protein